MQSVGERILKGRVEDGLRGVYRREEFGKGDELCQGS